MGKKASAKNAVATDLRLYDRPSKHGKSSTSAELRLAKKKKVSKKNKLAWRKHTDVADIEAFIDEKRQEERSGCVCLWPDISCCFFSFYQYMYCLVDHST